MIIGITEYAALHGRSAREIRAMAKRGRFKTAEKIGNRIWVIDNKEPYPEDARIKNGKYIDWRKKYPGKATKNQESND